MSLLAAASMAKSASAAKGASAGSGSGSGLGGMSGSGGLVSGIGKIYSTFADLQEFTAQVGFQQKLLTNTAEMVIAQRDTLIFDTNLRQRIVSGSIVARSGKAGVAVDSGSVINAMADVAGMAEVERLRINVNAENQVNVLNAQKDELGRQIKAKRKNAFISAGFQVASMATGGS